MRKRKSKRPVILLEVMIALFLVVIALLPLLYPHVAIVKEESKMTNEMFVFPKLSEFHGLMVEKIYNKELTLEQIKGKVSGTIDNLEHFQGSYLIETDKKKEGSPNSYYLVGFKYTLTPNSGGKPLEFHHQLFCKGPSLESEV